MLPLLRARLSVDAGVKNLILHLWHMARLGVFRSRLSMTKSKSGMGQCCTWIRIRPVCPTFEPARLGARPRTRARVVRRRAGLDSVCIAYKVVQ
jgi:hypothetical protein